MKLSNDLSPVGDTLRIEIGVSYPQLVFGGVEPNERAEVALNRQAEAQERLNVEPDVSGYQAPAPQRKAAMPARRK